MEIFTDALRYALDPANDFGGKVFRHLELSGVSLLLAVLVGVPVGIWASRHALLAAVAINAAGIIRVVPPIAVLFLLLPLLGIGFWAPVVALTLLAIPPLVVNSDAGMRGVDRAVLEAGRGMGMSEWQLLRDVQLPLALPVLLAGLRIAALEVIASATLAVLIGGGGLGEFIATGLALNRSHILLVGAVPVAVMALAVEIFLAYLQRRVLRRAGLEPALASPVRSGPDSQLRA